MKTEVIKIDPDRPALTVIKKTAEVIRNGGLVILPTDTVYGLVCDAMNSTAVGKVFKVKKRPLSQPLSIAINDFRDVTKYVTDIPNVAKILAKKFLPGPLTIILKKAKTIPDIVTAGRNDIGIRIPDCKFVLRLIKILQKPIVIPSANIHNQPPPISVKETLKDFDGKVELIIDGGETKYRKESTIVSCINENITILRIGVISAKKIFSALK
ncbi:MAG: L-threonylcarbamoyladenylate synthase [candidate division WOR-3 bacterium]